MPRLTRYLIKTALICLALSLILGAVLAARSALALPDEIAAFSPVFFHLFMVGWVSQLIFGMLFWMLPKYSRELPRRHEKVALPRFSHEPRYGNQRLGWMAYAMLNAGVLLAGAGAWWGAPPAVILCGRLAELSAGVFFALHAWPRVKPIGL